MSKTRKIILIIQANEGLAEFNHPIIAKRHNRVSNILYYWCHVGREKEVYREIFKGKRAILKYPFNKLN